MEGRWQRGTVLLTAALLLQLAGCAGGVRRVDVAHHARRRTLRAAPGTRPEPLLGLGPGEQLRAASTALTARGTRLVRLGETYQHVPVSGQSVVVEVDASGRPTGHVRGRLVTGLQEDVPSVVPRLEADDALQLALIHSHESLSDIKFNPRHDARLQLHVGGVRNNMKARLTYKLSYRIESSKRVARPTFIIDANSGEIIKQWDGISLARRKVFMEPRSYMSKTEPTENWVAGVGGNAKVGRYMYGSGTKPSLQVSRLPNGMCVLVNDLVEVYHCQGSYECDTWDMEPHQFNCSQGNQDHTNGAYSPLNDAFFHAGQTYRMFKQWFDTDDIFLLGEPVRARVHYGEQFGNAFWDGETITLGDGGDDLFPLTSVNMVAHEMAHGFTEARAGLENTGQSGAINEAFSDMVGETAEYFTKNTTDWTVSYADTKQPNASLRYFVDPTKDGRSISHYRDFCLDAEAHSASGIYNKAFYILATSRDWDIRKAFHVFFMANDLYWHPDSQFQDAACDVVYAAGELGHDVDDVKKAFREVGVEPCADDEAKNLPGPVIVGEGFTMVFKIVTHEIAVDELMFVVESYEPVEMSIDTGGMVFEVKSPHGNLPHSFTLPTVAQCLNQSCTVTVSAALDTQLSVYPMAHLKTIVTADSLGHGQTIQTAFSIPELAVNAGVRLVFRATVAPGGGLIYYIQHGRQPDVDSHTFDLMGTHDHGPMLCNPRNGTYYIRIVPLLYSNSPVQDVNVGLYASFNGELFSETETNFNL